MIDRQVNFKNVSQLCTNLKRVDPTLFTNLRQLMYEWRDSQQTQQVFKKLGIVLKGQRKIIDHFNSFLIETSKIQTEKVTDQINTQVLSYLKNNKSKDRIHRYIQYLKQAENQQEDDQRAIVEGLLVHFKDVSQVCKLIRSLYSRSGNNQPAQPRRNSLTQNQVQNKTTQQVVRDEVQFISKLSQELSQEKFDQVIKLIFLYEQCIITKHEILALLQNSELAEASAGWQLFKTLISSTEVSRRKASPFFKPLIDIDCSKSLRATHSYVKMPQMYPVKCTGKQLNPSIKSILNDKWVSVPVGSQHSTFHIMHKNQFEQTLLKSQDQRYQLDTLIQRCRRVQFLILNILGESDKDLTYRKVNQNGTCSYDSDAALQQIIKLGIIQLLYKPLSRQQKTYLQIFVKNIQSDSLRYLLNRILEKLSQFQYARNIYGLRTWQQISQKNFQRSLDRKSFQFKKNDKTITKDQFYMKELQIRMRQFRNQQTNYFSVSQDLHSNLTILNSFEGLSVNQCCVHNYDSQSLQAIKKLEGKVKAEELPLFILCFDQQSICKLVYSLLIHLLDQTYAANANQKNKIRFFIHFILGNFLGWQYQPMLVKQPKKQQAKAEEQDEAQPQAEDNQPDHESHNLLQEEEDIRLMPRQDKDSISFYCSSKVYCFIRIVYTIYQRTTKARQLLSDQQLRQLLDSMQQSLKSRQNNNRWEDVLRQIFSSNSYMFSTLNKVFEQAIRYAQNCSSQAFTSSCIELFNNRAKHSREDLNFLEINKRILSFQCNKIIVRVLLKGTMLYINCFNAMYQNWESDCKDKENQLKLVAKKIQDFTKIRENDRKRNKEFQQRKSSTNFLEELRKKCRDRCQFIKNRAQYRTAPNSFHLYNLIGHQDFLSRAKRSAPRIGVELKREIKLQAWLNRQQTNEY